MKTFDSLTPQQKQLVTHLHSALVNTGLFVDAGLGFDNNETRFYVIPKFIYQDMLSENDVPSEFSYSALLPNTDQILTNGEILKAVQDIMLGLLFAYTRGNRQLIGENQPSPTSTAVVNEK